MSANHGHSPLITFVTGASRLRVPNPIPVELIGVLLLNPVVNPDGVFSSVEAGSLQIQNSPATDETGGTPAAANAARDVNGDGIISQFRYKDPRGRYVVYDADPRVMLPLGQSTLRFCRCFSFSPR